MTDQRPLYEASDSPVSQNRMCDSAEEARSYLRGFITVVSTSQNLFDYLEVGT